MSVTEQPSQVSATHPEGAAPTADRKKMVRELAVAVGVLMGVFTAVLVYFFSVHHSSKEDKIARAAITTAQWLDSDGAGSIVHPEVAGDSDGNEQSTTGNTESVAEAVDVPVSPNGTKTGTVKSGVPVITSLQRLGLSSAQSHQIIAALEGVFDFRRSRPGDNFELKVDGKGDPTYFAYHASLTDVYEVRRRGGSLTGRKKRIPTTLTEKRFGGTIASSLYRSLSDVGAHASLAGKVADVLSNEVNFYKEQRPGDTFRVVVKEETLNGKFLGYGPILALEYHGVKAGKKRFFRFEAKGKEAAYYSDKGISQPRSVISIPLHYTRISSRFGMRYHPVLRRKRLHNGVDFAASTGTPVWACAAGEVFMAGRHGANGNLVGINHGDGLQSFYAHLHRFGPGIKKGVSVRKRQVIGYVGNTGRSTGPHLHFGLKKGGKFLDPLKYKVQPGRPIASRYRKQLKSIISDWGRKLDATRIKPPSEPLAKVQDKDEVLGLEDW